MTITIIANYSSIYYIGVGHKLAIISAVFNKAFAIVVNTDAGNTANAI